MMKSSFKPQFEKLEDRLAPATFTGASSPESLSAPSPNTAGTYGRGVYRVFLDDGVTSRVVRVDADPTPSAIVFVGGWGSSSYQYAFGGTHADVASRLAFNDDITPADPTAARGAALHLKPLSSGGAVVGGEIIIGAAMSGHVKATGP